ncbi:Mechanosensitive ion channel [Alkalitalea saponilacus]|uniref:Mechanosensitive ion channel n=2 Tax=Alkalitalea saponilacus TaxID=889453 RepID=A0A1T5FPC3_9BACT|nr:Mechanosensitive ion channel [Alkalitalea saponilacus]
MVKKSIFIAEYGVSISILIIFYQVLNMKKPNIKEIRLKYLSVSVLVTLFTLILLQTAGYLDQQKIICIPNEFLKIINSVKLVIATIFFTTLLLRISIKRVYNLFDEVEESIFYSKIYSWTIYSIGAFVILHHFGVSLGNITLFIGLLATGLAFAIRDVLLSFFGWMILLRKKPFRIGDYIRIGDDVGKVLHIGTFYVLLDNTDHLPENFTRIPNRIFLEKSIVKLGTNLYHDKITFQLSAIPENHKEIQSLLVKDMQRITNKNELLSVYIDVINEKLLLVVEYMVDFENRHETRDSLIGLVINHFKNNIHIPVK